MSRTFKDRKESKAKRKRVLEPLWTKTYERRRYEGPNENEDLEICPECHSPTDFQDGFITCPACKWGNYYPANGYKEEDDELEYQLAS